MEELREYLKSRVEEKKRAIRILGGKIPNDRIMAYQDSADMYERMLESINSVGEKCREAFHIGYENCQYNHSLTVTARKVDLDKWIKENV